MNSRRVKKQILLSLSVFLFFLSGCSASVQPPTETPTLLPTDTPLPTSTFTPTKIPSPLTIAGCFYKDACDYAYPIRDYVNQPVEFNVEYLVIVYTGSAVWFSFDWCAADRTTLIDNRKNMEFVFTIDGVSYLEALDQGNTSMQDQNDPAVFYPCYSIGGVLSGLENGKSYRVIIGAKLLADISNGWKSYSAGDYLYMFLINSTDAATLIPPAATPTQTREPIVYNTTTPTDVPTSLPSDTPVPPCIPGQISFTYAASSDPTREAGFDLYQMPGNTFFMHTILYPDHTVYIDVCQGVTYNYSITTAVGCSANGQVTAGGSIPFSCP